MPSLFRKITRKTLNWIALAALFPIWGIGATQLLFKSVRDFPDYSYPYASTVEAQGHSIVSFILASAWLTVGIALTLRAVCVHQTDRIPRLDEMIRAAQSAGAEDDDDTEYDSPPKFHAPASDHLSYTRLWYLSFQNHLLSKSGFDTLKLTPLKKWPAILKAQMAEDLVPVWNLPLLLISIASIPALAIFIAAVDVIVRGLTGFSFCDFDYQIANGISLVVSFFVFSFPIPLAILVLLALGIFAIPRIAAFMLKRKMQDNELKAQASEMILNSMINEGAATTHSENHNLATET